MTALPSVAQLGLRSCPDITVLRQALFLLERLRWTEPRPQSRRWSWLWPWAAADVRTGRTAARAGTRTAASRWADDVLSEARFAQARRRRSLAAGESLRRASTAACPPTPVRAT